LQQHLFSPQLSPTRLAASCNHPQTFSAGVIGVSLADGSTRLVSGSVSNFTWRLALLPDDGQAMPSDWQ